MRSEQATYFTVCIGGKRNKGSMPTKEELMQRNSFPSVNQNRHLDKMLRKQRDA